MTKDLHVSFYNTVEYRILPNRLFGAMPSNLANKRSVCALFPSCAESSGSFSFSRSFHDWAKVAAPASPRKLGGNSGNSGTCLTKSAESSTIPNGGWATLSLRNGFDSVSISGVAYPLLFSFSKGEPFCACVFYFLRVLITPLSRSIQMT